MRVQPLARHERAEDIGRPLADAVHFGVSHELLDHERRLAAHPFGVRRLVAHPAEDDLRIAQEPDRLFRQEDFRDGGFDPNVVLLLIRHAPHQRGQRFHGKEVRRHAAQPHLLRLPLAERPAEGHAGIGAIERRLPGLLRHAQADGRDADGAADVENRQRVFEAFADLADDVLHGNAHIRKRHVRIFDAPAPFELAALAHRHPGGIHRQDKRAVHAIVGALPFQHRGPRRFAVDPNLPRGHAGDQRDKSRDGSVRAPQLLSVHHEMRAGSIERRFGPDIRGVRTRRRLRQREGGDRLFRDDGQVRAFLRLIAEEENRHRDPDGLGHRDGQRKDVARARNQREDAAVIGVGKAEPAVLPGNLHAECAQVQETLDHCVWDLRHALDFVRVHLALEEGLDLAAIGFALGSFFNRLGRREQQIEVRASDEDAGHKAGPREALPRFLDPLQTLEQFTHGRKARLPRARCQGAVDRLKNYTYPTLL